MASADPIADTDLPVLDAGRRKLTRDAILTEAAALFKRNGYHKTRLEDLARLLGVTRPAFYYHFRDKKSILSAIHMRAITGLVEQNDAILQKKLPAGEMFWSMIEGHIEFVARNAIEAGIVLEEEEELSGVFGEKVRQLRREYTLRFVEKYRDAVDAGTATDVEPRLAVNTLLGAATWVHRWYRPEMGSPHIVAREMLKILRAPVVPSAS
jgi:AcrR family transcriptional regulator